MDRSQRTRDGGPRGHWLGNRDGSVPRSRQKLPLISVTLEAYLCKIGNREITLALGASGMAYALWRTRMRSQESHEMVF